MKDGADDGRRRPTTASHSKPCGSTQRPPTHPALPLDLLYLCPPFFPPSVLDERLQSAPFANLVLPTHLCNPSSHPLATTYALALPFLARLVVERLGIRERHGMAIDWRWDRAVRRAASDRSRREGARLGRPSDKKGRASDRGPAQEKVVASVWVERGASPVGVLKGGCRSVQRSHRRGPMEV